MVLGGTLPCATYDAWKNQDFLRFHGDGDTDGPNVMWDNERLNRWNNSTRDRSSLPLSRKTPQRSENPKAATKAESGPGDRRRAKSPRCFFAKFQVHHEDTSRDWEFFELFLIENACSPVPVAFVNSLSSGRLPSTSRPPRAALEPRPFLRHRLITNRISSRLPPSGTPTSPVPPLLNSIISQVFLSAVFVPHCERGNSYRCRR